MSKHSDPQICSLILAPISQVNMEKEIVVAPCGGDGGTDWDDGCYDGIRKITLKHGRCIDSICVVYDKDGQPFKGGQHGGSGGSITSKIKLQFPDEYLTAVSGYCTYFFPVFIPVIRSLTFRTNRRTFGPFGVVDGTPFSVEGGQIVGFKGKSGWYLDAIGFYIARAKPKPKPKPKPQQSQFRRLTSSVSLVGVRDDDEA